MKFFPNLNLLIALTFGFLSMTSLQAEAQGFIEAPKQAQILIVNNFTVPTYTRGQTFTEQSLAESKDALVAGYPTQSAPLFNGITTAGSEQNTGGQEGTAIKFAVMALQIAVLAWGLPTVVVGVLNLACGKSEAVGKIVMGVSVILGGVITGGIVNLVSG